MNERRSENRTRTRLRPGKLIGENGRHLADCAILDRSSGGVRLRLHEEAKLDGPVRLLDERDRMIFDATLVWVSAPAAGLRVDPAGQALEGEDFVRATGPYYAVR